MLCGRDTNWHRGVKEIVTYFIKKEEQKGYNFVYKCEFLTI